MTDAVNFFYFPVFSSTTTRKFYEWMTDDWITVEAFLEWSIYSTSKYLLNAIGLIISNTCTEVIRIIRMKAIID